MITRTITATTISTPTRTTTDAMSPSLLTLVQWLSPAFPTGAFACSHGLETAIADGRLANAQQVQDWVANLLRHGSGWQDALLLAAGLEPGADLDALTDLAHALASSAERLAETRDQGTAFARTLGQHPPRPLPLALAQAARPLREPAPLVVALYLNSFATNLVTIATRAVPLGQTQAQGILAALRPLVLDLADRAARATLDDLAASCLAADLASMAHETLQPRLYRT
jgi:urease accessory protein